MKALAGKKLGFIGLGLMGKPIAARLHAAGYEIVVLARHAAYAKDVAYACEATPEALAAACDVVFTCLPSPEASIEVYCGKQGLLAGGSRPVLVELSTIDLMTAQQLSLACEQAGVSFLDAPVSGGPAGAQNGALSIMVGGDESLFEACKPMLSAFGSKIFHMGPSGAGVSTKLCNQMLTGVTHVLVAEAMVLGAKMGLNPERLYEVLHASSGQSNSLDRAVPKFILPRNFDAAFAMSGIYKDMECVTRTGKALSARLLLAAVAQQVYQEACSAGLGDKDAAGVYLSVERAAGISDDGVLTHSAAHINGETMASRGQQA